ncbi:PREDICTED: uncharacterized protein LOC104589109 [Nelumbo nucifera]|uniref:Uncharacterized protein n=2 Tax=Nelumbo nucifera TaxID=4432 RepID=A0A822ZF41_NELNU|nr:PREDICTED: uncharacterized protein LOC104589109 [Nelumbo nucifera]DAD41616.1 TPA_asm: hypothetical protein HUJ06_015939 [Nelumbo nucifera]
MEKKKKDNKLQLTSQEAETNEFEGKEDQNQTGIPRKNPRNGSPPHENAPPVGQQYQPIFQWPYTPQPTLQQSPMIPRPLPTQQIPTLLLNRWQSPLLSTPQQPQQQQQSVINNQFQQGQLPYQASQTSVTMWLPPRPGFHALGGAYQPAVPMGTTDSSWQTSFVAGGNSSRNEPHVPGFCFQGAYSHPIRCSGPWDPSSWWSQGQQTQPAYAFPGAYGYFPVTLQPALDYSASCVRTPQKGIIRPQTKLSQKHQQMWEAQSMENVQLWTAISQLQSEMAAYGNRLMKLEAEVLSLKPTMEEIPVDPANNALAGQQTSKRGRPKKPIATVDGLHSPDKCQPRSRGRKPTQLKVQSKTKGINSEKGVNKVEDREKGCHAALVNENNATIQQENDGRIPKVFTSGSSNFELNGASVKLPVEVQATTTHQESSGTQMGGAGFNPTSEIKGDNNKEEEKKTTFSINQQVKGSNIEGASTTYRATVDNGNNRWPSNILPDDSERSILDMRSHSLYGCDSVIRQGGKVVPGWGFANEENASEEHDDVVVGSGKEDEDEMEEDTSSGADEIGQAKADCAYGLDPTGGTSDKVLPQLNRW